MPFPVYGGSLEPLDRSQCAFRSCAGFSGAESCALLIVFIDILNTDTFRKHSASDSRDPFFSDYCSFPSVAVTS